MDFVDILKKLREYQEQGHDVSDAIKSTELTQNEAHGGEHTTSGRSMTKGEMDKREKIVKGMKGDKSGFKKRYGKDAEAVMYATATKQAMKDSVSEHCHNFADFLRREGSSMEKLDADGINKMADKYAQHKVDVSKDESVNEVGGMSDVHIGAQEIVGDYTDEDGNLKMPKVQVIADMDKKKRAEDFPKSYEYDVAMDMVRNDFQDGGMRRPEIDAESEVQEKQGVDHDKDGDIDSKDYLKSRDIAIKQSMGKDINKKDDMKKEDVKEDMHITSDDPKDLSMLMQIMKLAGIRPVTSDMMSQGDDKHDETELANSPDGYTNDQKVQSLDDLLNTHSGGLNRQKVQVKKGHPGDNELTAESDVMRKQYEAFKENYKKASESK